jgi:hypothetical protein
MFIAVGVPISPAKMRIKPFGQLKGSWIETVISLFLFLDESGC